MHNVKYNEKAANDVYKNASLALQSLADLIPSVKNKELKKELKEQYSGYENAKKQIAEFMDKAGYEKKDAGFFQKAGMWLGIKMKTVFGVSKNQVAEMMTKGTINGINELAAMKNESKNLDEGVKEQVLSLLSLEENYYERLKKYL